MKKPKRVRRKAEFWKGQVVTMADDKEGYLFRVGEVRVGSGETQYLDESAREHYHLLWYDESDLRRLTAKEKGPRRKGRAIAKSPSARSRSSTRGRW